MLIALGPQPIAGFHWTSWLLYIFPWVNILFPPLLLLARRRSTVVAFTLWLAGAGAAYCVYLACAILVFGKW